LNHYERENEFEYEVENYTEEELLTSGGDFSFMSFFLGGLFANVFMPKKQKPIRLQNIGNYPSEKNYTSENSLSEDEKNFLSLVWAFEKEIKLAEKERKWVRLYCLLQAVRHLNETQWKKYIDGNFINQQLLDDNLLGLLNYILEMNPETKYWPKISQNVKDELEKGGLNIELEDLTFTFHGKPLTEEPW